MSKYAQVVALVEGLTEQIFIQKIIAPHLATSGIYMTPIIVSKPGQKGGDVRFARVKNDIERHLKQREDTYLTLLVDFYGIKGDWPGLKAAKEKTTSRDKADTIINATKKEVDDLFSKFGAKRRFIPYIAMHEFEALLFSDAQILAKHLLVTKRKIDQILTKCGAPEEIDDSPKTAPSKRLETLSPRFKKTITGISVARQIGLCRMREQCPLFNDWLINLERIKSV